MSTLIEPLRQGGSVVGAILVLSLILYTRCFSLLLQVVRSRRKIGRLDPAAPLPPGRLRAWQEELQDSFERQEAMLRTMIVAAPLLGLLGTVTGMIRTFESLSAQAGQRSMDALAGGISEALIATQAGLCVAIPAVLLVRYAHRQLQKSLHDFTRLLYGPQGGR